MIFPRACALADVAWSGAARSPMDGAAGRPPPAAGRRGPGVPAAERPAARAGGRHGRPAAPARRADRRGDRAPGRAGRRRHLARRWHLGHVPDVSVTRRHWPGKQPPGGRGRGSRGQIRSSDVTVRGSAQTVPIPVGYGYGRPPRRWWVRLLRVAIGVVVIVVCLSLLALRRPAADLAVRRQRPADRRRPGRQPPRGLPRPAGPGQVHRRADGHRGSPLRLGTGH